MDLEVYSDESGFEALTDKTAHKFICIGSICLPKSFRKQFKNEFKSVLHKYKKHGELKWNKVSLSFRDVYISLLDLFFHSDFLRFRAIILEPTKIDHTKYFNHHDELGFYKFYYQLFHKWVYDFNSYDFYLDYKSSRSSNHIHSLHKALNLYNDSAKINLVQSLPSSESAGIQLCDILSGMVLAKFNNNITNTVKHEMISTAEKHLQSDIDITAKSEKKFNISMIGLSSV